MAQTVKEATPFAFVVENVVGNSATAVEVMDIKAGTFITGVAIKQTVQGVRAAGAANVTIGDDDDADGYVVAQDCKAAVGTTYGLTNVKNLGAYVVSSAGITCTAASADAKPPIPGKYYSAAKTLKLVLDQTMDTQPQFDVFVTGVILPW